MILPTSTPPRQPAKSPLSLPAHLQRSVAPAPSTVTVLVDPPALTYMTLRSLPGTPRTTRTTRTRKRRTGARTTHRLPLYNTPPTRLSPRNTELPPARGVIFKFNPEGYDDSQVLRIHQLQINDAYSVMRQAEKTGDAWLPQDPTPCPAATEPGVHFQINMMSTSAPTVNTDIASDDEDDAELPLIGAFDASRINKPSSTTVP
jgi:hypothetical protein